MASPTATVWLQATDATPPPSRPAAEQQRAELAAEHEAAGVQVVEDEGHRPTGYIVVADLGVDAENHASEPCHAVVITDRHDGPQAIAVCTDRRRHTKAGASELKAQRRDDDGRAAEREQAKERKRVAAARREFVAQRLGRRLPKGQATTFVIRTLLDKANANDSSRAGEMLGATPVQSPYGPAWAPALRDVADRGDAELVRVGVALAVAMAEANLAAHVGLSDLGRDYLGFLSELGYTLDGSEHEARQPAADAAAAAAAAAETAA